MAKQHATVPEPFYEVAIIGAGFSGSLTAIHLMADANLGNASVAMIEKELSAFGKGVAYGTPFAQHLLNVPAGKMGAFPDRMDDFLHWAQAHPEEADMFGVETIEAGSFLPRARYGRYVASLLEDAAARANGRLRRVAGEAVDIVPVDLEDGGEGFRVELVDGRRLRAAGSCWRLGRFHPVIRGCGTRGFTAAHATFIRRGAPKRTSGWRRRATRSSWGPG